MYRAEPASSPAVTAAGRALLAAGRRSVRCWTRTGPRTRFWIGPGCWSCTENRRSRARIHRLDLADTSCRWYPSGGSHGHARPAASLPHPSRGCLGHFRAVTSTRWIRTGARRRARQEARCLAGSHGPASRAVWPWQAAGCGGSIGPWAGCGADRTGSWGAGRPCAGSRGRRWWTACAARHPPRAMPGAAWMDRWRRWPSRSSWRPGGSCRWRTWWCGGASARPDRAIEGSAHCRIHRVDLRSRPRFCADLPATSGNPGHFAGFLLTITRCTVQNRPAQSRSARIYPIQRATCPERLPALRVDEVVDRATPDRAEAAQGPADRDDRVDGDIPRDAEQRLELRLEGEVPRSGAAKQVEPGTHVAPAPFVGGEVVAGEDERRSLLEVLHLVVDARTDALQAGIVPLGGQVGACHPELGNRPAPQRGDAGDRV